MERDWKESELGESKSKSQGLWIWGSSQIKAAYTNERAPFEVGKAWQRYAGIGSIGSAGEEGEQ